LLSQVSISNSVEVISQILISKYKPDPLVVNSKEHIKIISTDEANADLEYLLFGKDNSSDLQLPFPLSEFHFKDRRVKKRKGYNNFLEFKNKPIEVSDMEDNFEELRFKPAIANDFEDVPVEDYDFPNSPIQGFTNLNDVKHGRDPQIDLYFKQLESKQTGNEGNKKARPGINAALKKAASGGKKFWNRRGGRGRGVRDRGGKKIL
ncbi:hypothetical protein HK096_005655, partial [Nowakowskiella sp. JEL0078]